jgi:hypothetical protein
MHKWEKEGFPRYSSGSAGFAQETRLERRQEINVRESGRKNKERKR